MMAVATKDGGGGRHEGQRMVAVGALRRNNSNALQAQ